MKKLWNWVKSLFTGGRIGIIWSTIFTAARTAATEALCDPDNQRAALDLVRKLASSQLTNDQRRKEFDAQMRSWAEAAGKTITEAALNALRENAVIAAKCEENPCTGCDGCCAVCERK